MKTKDYYKQIEEQEKKSDKAWRNTHRETSPTERKKNMWKRVTDKVKTDRED